VGTVSSRHDKNGEPGDDKPISDELIDEELIGLDPEDPETKAFAEHLSRMRGPGGGHNAFTVEGYLNGVGEFANSVNRANGHRRLMAVIVIGLILLGVLFAVWETLGLVFGTIFR
jgi:hypothetical protein